MKRDLISVVISVLNGCKTLESCIESVVKQNYEFIELIVIDGGSDDGTLSIIEKFKAHIRYSISEPDTGIYNAWNKALNIAKGDWVCFIGSDDRFATNDSLNQLASIATYPTINYVSARIAPISSQGKLFKAEGVPYNKKDLGKGMKFCHPGSLHHISLFRNNGLFNENYQIGGDYEFFLRCNKSILAAFTSSTVVLMGNEGISNTLHLEVFLEGYKALKDNPEYGHIVALRFFITSFFKSWVRKLFI